MGASNLHHFLPSENWVQTFNVHCDSRMDAQKTQQNSLNNRSPGK